MPDADEVERRPLPRSARITLHLLASALIAFLLLAAFSKVDLVVSARGRLGTPLPNIVVQPLETSIIEKIEVKPGQIVKKGERLATLDPTFAEADESQLRTRLKSLDNQRASLEAELAGKTVPTDPQSSDDQQIQSRLSGERKASYLAQTQRLDENIGRVRAALETNRRDQSTMTSRAEVLKEMVAMQERLVEQKYAVRARLLDAQDRFLEVERGRQMARSKEQELQRELMALQAERVSFQTGWRQKVMEELLAVSRDRDGLNEQLQKAGKRQQLVVLTAPSDAVILEIAKLSTGSVAKAAEPLFTLVPLGDSLEAEVQIESVDVGYVKRNDLVRVKVDAYPFQLHGALEGKLHTISEDAFRRDAGSSGGIDSYYLGRIQLGKTLLNRLPEHARLLPGMTVTAEIAVGKRSVISYLLWPLIKALDESIREP
ncbi:MAG: HlyD family type I secretion periplasmic adaptor subunit [Rhodocyclaceae bacterium]